MYFKPYCFLKVNASTSVAVRLTTSDIKVSAVSITAEISNTGRIYGGDNQVSSTNYGFDLGPGDLILISAEQLGVASAYISLKDFWFVPSVGTDGVSVLYLERAE